MLLLDAHLARLEISCSLAKIPIPFPPQIMRQKIIDLASYCYNNFASSFDIRYWVSSGGNNFGILPDLKNNKSTFFIVAFEIPPKKNMEEMIDEVSIRGIDAKTGILARSKTTNYLINSMFAIEGAKKGGTSGIMTDSEGNILEGPISNVAFVFKNGEFVIPKFEKILRGTTLIECMRFIEEKLIKEGKIKRIVHMDFKPEDVFENAIEMMMIGGNKVRGVRKFDGRLISERVGAITKELIQYLNVSLVEISEKVPLNRYEKKIPNPKL